MEMGTQQPMPLSARQTSWLKRWIPLDQSLLARVQAGKPIAVIVPTNHPKEMAVAGLVWIGAPLSRFLDGQRTLAEKEGNRSVTGAEIFQQPPQLSDLANLKTEIHELSALARCRPADCQVKLLAADLAYLQTMDPASRTNPDAWDRRFRATLLRRLEFYQAQGNRALGDYGDKPERVVAADEFNELLAHSGYLHEVSPHLATYLRVYPRVKLDGGEDIFYWSKVQFGLKPTVRLNHLVLYHNQSDSEFPWVVASRQILSTHYFQAALELRIVLLTPGSDGRSGFYLLTVNRSRNDGMEGALAGLLRRAIRGKALEGTTRFLEFTRQQTQSPPLEASNSLWRDGRP